MRSKLVEFIVGLFMLAGLLGLIALALEVSGLTQISDRNSYKITAQFDNIGDLKERAPVRLSGVTVGRVTRIALDPTSLRAEVTMRIVSSLNDLPVDTSASILTEGLLGSNYISLSPGFDTQILKSGSALETTHSALILENLIGQLMFNLQNNNKNNDAAKTDKSAQASNPQNAGQNNQL